MVPPMPRLWSSLPELSMFSSPFGVKPELSMVSSPFGVNPELSMVSSLFGVNPELSMVSSPFGVNPELPNVCFVDQIRSYQSHHGFLLPLMRSSPKPPRVATPFVEIEARAFAGSHFI